MCTDYSSINNNIVVNQYQIPKIDAFLDRLSGSMVYRKLDLAISYYQLAIELIYNYRTAF